MHKSEKKALIKKSTKLKTFQQIISQNCDKCSDVDQIEKVILRVSQALLTTKSTQVDATLQDADCLIPSHPSIPDKRDLSVACF